MNVWIGLNSDPILQNYCLFFSTIIKFAFDLSALRWTAIDCDWLQYTAIDRYCRPSVAPLNYNSVSTLCLLKISEHVLRVVYVRDSTSRPKLLLNARRGVQRVNQCPTDARLIRVSWFVSIFHLKSLSLKECAKNNQITIICCHRVLITSVCSLFSRYWGIAINGHRCHRKPLFVTEV